MKLVQLSLKNFMNHREAIINFKNIKSALIVGKTFESDLISNGVGKSSVFSAIEWCLFNKVHKLTIDKAVRDGCKKAEVELEFESDSKQYKLYRSLTSKGTKNVYLYEFINNEWVPISQRSPTETEDYLKRIIKLSHKAFQYCVLFRQADLTGLVESDNGSETNNKDRVDILKEPLNLIRYSKKEKLVNDLIKPIKKEIDNKEEALKLIGNPEQDIISAKSELEKCILLAAEKENSVKNDLKIALEEKVNNLAQLKSTLSSSDADIHKKVEEQHAKVKKLNYNIKELTESHKKTIQNLNLFNASLNDKLKANEALSNELSDKKLENHRDIDKISSELKKVQEDEIKGNNLLTRAEVEYEHSKKSIPDSDNCPSCNQSITKEYRCEFEEKANKVLEKKKEEISFYKTALTKCKALKSKLQKELELSKEHNNLITSLELKIKTNSESISAYRQNINMAEIGSKKIESQLDAYTAELEESIKHYNTLKELASKSDLAELNSKIFSIAREIKVYEQSIESLQAEIQNIKTREAILGERIKIRELDKEKYLSLTKELDDLRKSLKIHTRVASSFSHKGIPTLIINKLLNELQFETNKALQDLRPDLEVKFDADLNFTFRRNGKERSYHQLSYGQHVYIALAFKRGLARVVQRLANIEIGFMEFDEVDSALDKAGVEALANAIKKWQDQFLVLMITHNDSLKDKFSHAIVVEEGNDGCETRLATSW